MAKKKFRIKGKVIDRQTGSGAPGLRVEAWDKDLIVDDLVGSAVTRKSGAFRVEFDEKYFQGLFGDRQPDLFFKVFQESHLIGSTEDSVLWNIKDRVTDLIIEVDLAGEKPQTQPESQSQRQPLSPPQPQPQPQPKLPSGESFVVGGLVRLPSGAVQKRQRVIAFDLDLPGVAVYRQVTELSDLRTHEGFEYLGEAVSDGKGAYEITFYESQYAKAERNKADVVVYALDGESISGRSRLINSEDYSDQGQITNLDVFITRTDDTTEYVQLMQTLNAFLEENKTTLAQIASSSDQVNFCAGELELEPVHVSIAAAAELLTGKKQSAISHELLYGIGRQNISLSTDVLAAKSDDELRHAINQSAAANIIRKFTDQETGAFLRQLHDSSLKNLLENTDRGKTLNATLSNALPKSQQRLSFINAVRNFKGSDFGNFWNDYLPAQAEFKDQPQLVANLKFNQQLLLLSGSHDPLVTELQTNRKISSIGDLFALGESEWSGIIAKTGVPDFVPGKDAQDQAAQYADMIQASLSAAFPTQRIATMLAREQLPVESPAVNQSIQAFLSQNENFDISRSRIHEFEKQIKAAAGEHAAAVTSELKSVQRVFQVSPRPEAMSVLIENKLNSATAIANIPRKSFINEYATALGGNSIAAAVHERASHISTRSEFTAMHLMEYSKGTIPQFVLGAAEQADARDVIEAQVPNYSELFGAPDICECEECNSVYSAAAYFIDLLRFLWRSSTNDDGRSPLDMLSRRRPDLLYLPLTCENTNTIIPYIDLANEVMEFYTAHGSLAGFEGYDTGEATAEELRANPQNFNLEAYRELKDAKYPFTLPYHQPLDVIRTFSNYLGVSRYEVMKAINPEPDGANARAIAAESLELCEEEYEVLTGKAFDSTPDPTTLHEYYGYTSAGDLENLSAVREFLRRSGLAYTDLVELVTTSFINPFQGTLDFLQNIFSFATIDSNTLYARLEAIEAGSLDPADDPDIVAALTAYNQQTGSTLTPADLGDWIVAHLKEFRQVITLFEPESRCDLDTTSLRTIRSIYEAAATSGITKDSWSKIHRFIRLWRKLGWTIQEVDLMLAALGVDDLTAGAINKFESVTLLKTATRLLPNQLAVFWGNIDSYGSGSLYQKLFLNKAVQQIDDAFKADAFGNYLTGNQILSDHKSAILAAFKISEEDLTSILQVAGVIEGGNQRPLALETDVLNLENLSTIYRYVMLAKGLTLRVTELTDLIGLFDSAPFSIWDIDKQKFTAVSPSDTYAFYELAAATKSASFKAAVLEYILQGTLPADSNIGLARADILQAARDVRAAFDAIAQDHPEPAVTPLTSAILTAELSLTFAADIVAGFIGILESTKLFETITDNNLDVDIPNEDSDAEIAALVAAGTFPNSDAAAAFLRTLATKYTYVNGSGRLTCAGTMSDLERDTLKGLAHVNANFETAVDELYAAPEAFIATNFGGIFDDLTEANIQLLDHPAQTTAASLDEKLAYVYELFEPVLKDKLRHDTITRVLAALIDLSEAATALLIGADAESIISSLSIEGFSADYFSDPAWTTSVLKRNDSVIDFSWGPASPDAIVPVDSFSARWEAYIAAPASGDYTLTVATAEADEAFNLFLDEALILQKAGGDGDTARDVIVNLNAALMSRLKLEYSEAVQAAGVSLSWKTATTGLETVPAAAAYPAGILDDFIDQVTIFHRAAMFISGFELSETELDHLISFNADFGNIDFKALDAGDWQRIYDYTTLRNSVPQAQALLTDVFALANTVNPAPTVDDLSNLLFLATAWDESSLEFLVGTQFALTVADFRNEIKLNQLLAVMKIVTSTGLSSSTIAIWGDAVTDFDALNGTAQLLKNGVKARYEDEDWLQLAGDLTDQIRERQKDSLVAYLLTRPAIQAWGATDADGLFEYFLIDVQMGACMDTSRIVQANSSVQMFVSRCLLNLESDTTIGSEQGVSPGAIDRDRWDWMQNYRVWEANRKVFLYPENWLEPEWRTDRSDFFEDLESFLVQNDITDANAEQAFRNYLTSLHQVANLEVCGLCRENYAPTEAGAVLKYLHVFARTHNAPYKFFYRTWDEYRKWSAWQQVAVDIRCIEDGNNSGVSLIPVVWKGKLILFWPEFNQQQAAQSKSNKTVEKVSKDKISSMEGITYWEIKLAWSEYVDGKWSAKQVSKEFLEQYPDESFATPKDLLFTVNIDATNQLTITVSDSYWNIYRGDFTLSDIQSPVSVNQSMVAFAPAGGIATGGLDTARLVTDTSVYSYKFSNRHANATLKLLNDLYLEDASTHNLLPVDTLKGLNITLDSPFFFSDMYRTYFVRPVPITVIDWIKSPGFYEPYLPGYVDHSGFDVPIEIHSAGPDDYHPVAELDPRVDAGPAIYYLAGAQASQPILLGSSAKSYSTTSQLSLAARVTPAARSAAPVETAIGRAASSITFENQDYVSPAFGYSQAGLSIDYFSKPSTRADTGLEFHTFYHPFSSQFVENLNQGGLDGLLDSDTSIASDNGAKFESTYSPNFSYGFVQKPADFSTGTYYKENVCFWVYGANSLYNWELFFHAPLYIATRLSKNGQFEAAMNWFHYIFDPTTDDLPGPGETEISRYWKVLPFKTTPAESLDDWFRENLSASSDASSPENAVIAEWRDNPFDPFLVAANRPLAFMKSVVVKYVENLIAWGDSRFRQFTMESVNEALQIYVIANHILGPRPEFVPKRGEIKAESYHSLSSRWDDFSNALVELENIFPYSSDVAVGDASTGSNLLGVGSAFYFCIPANDQLLELWDTVADRLFKIRHCQNIDGVEQHLALFAPPIDPGALIQAASQGLSLGSILADLSSPPPIYRFAYLIKSERILCRGERTRGRFAGGVGEEGRRGTRPVARCAGDSNAGSGDGGERAAGT
jgi:hypothetical protein